MNAPEQAPPWWHCDTHGPGNVRAWGCPECVREMRATIARLTAEVGALREDAERYRWLRSADNDLAPMIRPNGIGWQMLCGTRLDAAIDAARKAAATPPDAKGTMAQTGDE